MHIHTSKDEYTRNDTKSKGKDKDVKIHSIALLLRGSAYTGAKSRPSSETSFGYHQPGATTNEG
jgi:hypothetical protein